MVVCGYPRSGTSLLYNMLSSSLDGFLFEEFETRARKSIWKYEDCASKRPRDIGDLAELVRENVHGKRISVIVMIRDVRDVITSTHAQIPDRYYVDYDGRWAPRTGRAPRIERTGDGVASIEAAIDRARRVEGLEQITLRYEDLVASPGAVEARLARVLDLEFAGRFEEFHLVPERHAYRYDGRREVEDPGLERSRVDSTRSGRWAGDEHRERIREQFDAHPELFEVLRRRCYESDDRWYEPYRTGAPRVSTSAAPEP
ncbi:MAG: hypothetical protein JRG82_11000 [Deltaproteobacteria bacterium]|nr:hypothetical protein [Deltaproteobacteria bacterium]